MLFWRILLSTLIQIILTPLPREFAAIYDNVKTKGYTVAPQGASDELPCSHSVDVAEYLMRLHATFLPAILQTGTVYVVGLIES